MSSNNNLFIKQTLTFESKSINVEQVPINIIDAKFGILNLHAISAPLSQKEQDCIFMVDCSGSMSDNCSDGRTKMQHILHTLKNIILYFKENPDINVHITIDAFDDKIYNILNRTKITPENFNEIISMLNEIVPRGSTNIELALNHVSERVNQIQTSFSNVNINHIFMTDGDATSGNRTPSFLANLVNQTIDNNSFIGFGIDHDSNLLNIISSNDRSSYYFIDKLENSGLVYGEILHGILYKLLTNVQITIQNGLIYDFINNIWVDSLYVGEIVSEADKIYHIASSNTSNCVVTINAKILNNNDNILISISDQEEETDLTKYIYRQRTLQHLYIVSNFLKRKNEGKNYKEDILFYLSRANKSSTNNKNQIVFEEEEKLIKEQLKNFINEIKNYMSDNNLNDDKFLKNLCDDIYISYKTFGTKFGEMYNCARQASQGTQRSYTVSLTPNNITPNNITPNNITPNNITPNNINTSRSSYKSNGYPSPPKLRRHTNNINFDDDDDDDNNNNNNNDDNSIDLSFLDYEVSNCNDAAYLTPSSTRIMSEISNNL
jgi:hypothetical protein